MLFLLYINDIQNSSNLIDYHLFADDTSLFISNTNTKLLENTLNEELSKIVNWLWANKLTLNIDKSNYIIFY